MIRSRPIALAVAALPRTANAVAAQAHDHTAGHAGKESREIKALSAEEMAGYLAGEGMGMALAAELNGWPGPRHVLDLAEPLGLDPGTVAEVRAVHARMLAHRRAHPIPRPGSRTPGSGATTRCAALRVAEARRPPIQTPGSPWAALAGPAVLRTGTPR
jgi:hypothetical protein